MHLSRLHILAYKNLSEVDLSLSPKLNCFLGQNGMGKTNILDAIYYLSFSKSAFSAVDSLNIQHGQELAVIQGEYGEDMKVLCGLRKGKKKQFRLNGKDYQRLTDHIGLIPLIMISPEDQSLIVEGSDERRRFMDGIIAQCNKTYFQHLLNYNGLLKQRNALLKQVADRDMQSTDAENALFEVLEMRMTHDAEYIFAERTRFVEQFIPLFQTMVQAIADDKDEVGLSYISQLQTRSLLESYAQTRQRDLILGWTSQGIHKDDLEMLSKGYPIRQVGSQGQQKTYLIALKLAGAIYLSKREFECAERAVNGLKPILLLDDIFDKLDAERVARIVSLVQGEEFGQIFITDTDRQHLTDLLHNSPQAQLFWVVNGEVKEVKP